MFVLIKFSMTLINKQQKQRMIRNSTQKFKEKYGYASLKNFETINHEKQGSESSLRSVRFNTTQFLPQAKSTPKLQSSKRCLFKTQPLIYNNKKPLREDKYSQFTDHASIETIQTVMKKKGIEESQVTQQRPSKLRKINRNSAKVRDPETFIDNLPKNSLFFCCECYQYIFDIEKSRHYPDCKDQLNKSQPNIAKIGIQRLQRLVQLANYTQTNTKQINELFNQFTKGNRLNGLDYPKYNFFTLKEITYSFSYIYCQLLTNVKYESDSTIFTCF